MHGSHDFSSLTPETDLYLRHDNSDGGEWPRRVCSHVRNAPDPASTTTDARLDDGVQRVMHGSSVVTRSHSKVGALSLPHIVTYTHSLVAVSLPSHTPHPIIHPHTVCSSHALSFLTCWLAEEYARGFETSLSLGLCFTIASSCEEVDNLTGSKRD